MKFLHTGDWHIGKKIKGYALLEEQEDAFQQVLAISEKHAVDAVVIAGDLYDRSVPSVEAIELFNEMIQTINLKKQLPLLAVSGNHDSAVRLEAGGPWYQATHFHLNTRLSQAFQPVIIEKTQFFLLPYFEPFEARQYFNDDTIKTIQIAMERVVEEMTKSFLPDYQQVLVAHFFAAGSERSDSETSVTVGGLDNVSVSLLEDHFDYVALGHLHNRHALKNETVKYSGTLLKYSLSEVNQTKGVWIVTMEDGQVSVAFESIQPLRDVSIVEGSFSELLSPEVYQQVNRDDYIGIRLTDREVIPNVMNQLSSVYPKIIQLERVNGREHQTVSNMSQEELQQQDPLTLFTKFFEEMTDGPMSQVQADYLLATIQSANKEEN
ncbi:exonuclease SbcCD subunit D [Vagococcus xieshaowenii]|uniref:Nuclease SbcCD subunit D n=1 Tax=Vagococcus xieshaowenii TaxID=2562451 RepID=A0AAJ5EEH0_9ENTE|nr:exonuclease SbcCD subunit D [Vagococcus xieshaowenii]QCA27946.1 exonuclease SbcCD subunit D [Vagococcus xieshaowenii]TFZ41286.1 exonuclease SbcCD subunit D [Vagococcus xieshaowenii]